MMKQGHQEILRIDIAGYGTQQYSRGTSLEEVAKDFQSQEEHQIVAALVDNELKELHYRLDEDCEVKFINASSPMGSRIIQRGLVFVFIRAAMELLKGCRVTVEHSIAKGLYCEIHYHRPITQEDTDAIRARMEAIIEEDVPFIKSRVPVDEAKEIFREYGQMSKVRLLKYREKPYINLYQNGWLKSYFYGYMVPSSGYLKVFNLKYHPPGIVIQHPLSELEGALGNYQEQPKLFKIFRESEKWGEILEIDYVAALNDLIVSRRAEEFVHVQEALHEKKIGEIADQIHREIHQKRLILIAGPSSSGKTTFAQRLMIHLKVNGLKPVAISLDDYFVNREDTPLDEKGKPDFESLYAIDLETFNRDLKLLLAGEQVALPTFNFHTGKREYRGNTLRIREGQPIIIEGLHGLNDTLTREIPRENKFKIYISALTQLNVDEHNRIPTTDSRLIRRIVRDYRYRSKSALETLSHWQAVRLGEEKNIFPFQEEADVMFNSALFYEMSVLKKHAEPLLRQVMPTDPYYTEAKRLLKFLNYFVNLEDEIVPRTSILREFIGDGAFH